MNYMANFVYGNGRESKKGNDSNLSLNVDVKSILEFQFLTMLGIHNTQLFDLLLSDWNDVDKGWHNLKKTQVDLEQFVICSQLMGLEDIVKLLKLTNGNEFKEYHGKADYRKAFRIRLLVELFSLI